MTPPSAKRILPSLLQPALQARLPNITSYETAEGAVLEALRTVLATAEAQVNFHTATGDALALHGEALLAKKLGGETEAQFRARLAETGTLYRPFQGTEAGFKRILNQLGLIRPSWVYLFPGKTPCFPIEFIESLAIVCPDAAKKFLVGIVQVVPGPDFSAVDFYSWNGTTWDTHSTAALAYPEGMGSTAAELAVADWGLLITAPVAGMFLACEVTPEEQLALPRIHALLTYS